MRRRWLSMIAVLVPAVALLGTWVSRVSTPRSRAPDLLWQIHAAFKMYTAESSGLYPPTSAKPGEFAPDMDAFGEYLALLPDSDLLSAYLTGKCETRLCYLGHLVPSQRAALAFLDEYENRGVETVRHIGVTLQGKRALAGHAMGNALWRSGAGARLCEGMERYFMLDIGNPPPGRPSPAECVPIVWEVPDISKARGGWVLYIDGHTEWLPYGSFPITERLAARIRGLAPPAPVTSSGRATYRVDSRPPREYRRTKGAVSPVLQIAADIAGCLPPIFYRLVHCDIRPSVRVEEHSGYRICLSNNLEVILFPDDIKVDDEFKNRIWPRGSEKRNRVLADLGVGHGYHWFARATMWEQDTIRQELDLVGGDERFQLMVDTGALFLMPRLAERAMPYLESVVTDEENDDFADAIMALEQIGSAEARDLIRAAFDPDNKNAFQNAEAVAREAVYSLYGYGHPLTDETIEAVVEAFLTLEDRDELAGRAVGLATLTGMMVTAQRNRIGLAVLKRLPDDVVDRAIARLREASPSQAQRLEHELRKGQG